MLKNLRGLKLALVFSLALATAPGCAPVIAALPTVLLVVQGAELAINMIESFVNAYYQAHPDAAKQALCTAAIAKSRVALAAVLDVANGVGALDQAKLNVAFQDFEGAYSELTSLVGPIGIHVGKGLQATPGGLTVPSAKDLVAMGTRR